MVVNRTRNHALCNENKTMMAHNYAGRMQKCLLLTLVYPIAKKYREINHNYRTAESGLGRKRGMQNTPCIVLSIYERPMADVIPILEVSNELNRKLHEFNDDMSANASNT